MEYTIESWRQGRWVIVAEGTRKLVVCDSEDQAQRLLRQLNARENQAGEQGQETDP